MLNKIKAFMLSRKAVVLLAVFIAYAFFSVNNAYALFEVSIKKLRNLPKSYQYPAYIGDNKLFFAGDYEKEYSNKPEKITCASVYDMKKQKNIPLNACMNIPRSMYISIALPEDRVLVLGGFNKNEKMPGWTEREYAEIYDIKTNKFRTIGNATFKHNHRSSYVKLNNGKILIQSGMFVEIFDPKTEKFRVAGKLKYKTKIYTDKKGNKHINKTPSANLPIKCPSEAVELDNGNIFFAGVSTDKNDKSKNTVIYNPEINEFTFGPSQITPGGHRATAKLSDGRILVAGIRYFDTKNGKQNECEIYNPRTNTFMITDNLKTGRAGGTIVQGNKKTYIFAGSVGDSDFLKHRKDMNTYNEKTGKWKTVWNPKIRSLDSRILYIDYKTVYNGAHRLIKF